MFNNDQQIVLPALPQGALQTATLSPSAADPSDCETSVLRAVTLIGPTLAGTKALQVWASIY
jgi:hypothetical protein